MTKPETQITAADREAAEKYALMTSARRMEELFYRAGDSAQMLAYVNKRTDQITANVAEGFIAGILYERARAEDLLVKALESYKKTRRTDFTEVVDQALRTWRGEG